MQLYDHNPDDWRPPERFIGRCACCRREKMKKNMVTLLTREYGRNARTLCFFCPECWARFLDYLETRCEVNYGEDT